MTSIRVPRPASQVKRPGCLPGRFFVCRRSENGSAGVSRGRCREQASTRAGIPRPVAGVCARIRRGTLWRRLHAVRGSLPGDREHAGAEQHTAEQHHDRELLRHCEPVSRAAVMRFRRRRMRGACHMTTPVRTSTGSATTCTKVWKWPMSGPYTKTSNIAPETRWTARWRLRCWAPVIVPSRRSMQGIQRSSGWSHLWLCGAFEAVSSLWQSSPSTCAAVSSSERFRPSASSLTQVACLSSIAR